MMSGQMPRFNICLVCAISVIGFTSVYAQQTSMFKELDNLSLLENPQLSFDLKPKPSIRVAEGKSLKLSCAATSIPPASIKWLKDGKELESDGADLKYRNEAEKLSNFGRKSLQMASTKSEFVIDCVDKSKVGVYSCVAQNGYSEITANTTVSLAESNAVKKSRCVEKKRGKLSRFFNPSPARISMATDMRMELTGAAAELFCRASGWPTPQISWYTFDKVQNEENLGEGRKIKNDQNHLILNNGDLLVRSAGSLEGSGATRYYKCVAQNPLGGDSAMVMLVSIGED